jgi:hypothetical protein
VLVTTAQKSVLHQLQLMRVFTDQVELPDATTIDEISSILVQDGRLEEDLVIAAMEQLEHMREGASISIGVKQVLETVPRIENARNPAVRCAELLLERSNWKQQERRDESALY